MSAQPHMTLLPLDLVRSMFREMRSRLLVGLSPPDVTSRPVLSMDNGQADNLIVSLCWPPDGSRHCRACKRTRLSIIHPEPCVANNATVIFLRHQSLELPKFCPWTTIYQHDSSLVVVEATIYGLRTR